MDDALLKLLRYSPKLPTMPAVAFELIEIANRPSPTLVDVAAAIGRDAALTAKLLRVANSPLYGGRGGNVKNLRGATLMLGMNAVVSLALGFSLVGESVSGGGLEYSEFWRRSLIVGVAARVFGGRARCGDREMLFLAGVLQDIGMLVLDAAVPERYARVLAWGTLDHAALALGERAEFSADHAEIGAWLLAQWRLPDWYVQAARFSHAACALDLETLPHDMRRFASAVAVASAVAGLWCMPAQSGCMPSIVDLALRLLGMNAETVFDALDQIEAELPAIAALLDVQVSEQTHVRGLIDAAREAAMVRTLHAVSMLESGVCPAPAHLRDGAVREVQPRLTDWRDALTGLLNRAWLQSTLPASIESASGIPAPLSIVVLDLERFGAINDQYGYAAGDSVLIELAVRMLGVLRQGDACVRYSGAVFLIVLPGADALSAGLVARRLRDVIAMPVQLRSGGVANVCAVSGMSTFEPSGVNAGTTTAMLAADLVNAALQALSCVKQLRVIDDQAR